MELLGEYKEEHVDELREALYNFLKADRKDIKKILKGLPSKKLEKIRYAAGRVIEEEFERGREGPQYGILSRRLEKNQLMLFFETIENTSVKRAFLLQFFYGLRVGELSKTQYFTEQNAICIDSPKSGKTREFLPVIPGTENLLEHLEDIGKYSPHYLRKCFRAICRDAKNGLCFVYGHTKNTNRPQYLYTTHSLRHTAVDLVRRGSDELAAQMFARHSQSHKFGVTATYFHKSFEELRNDIKQSLSPYVRDLLSDKELTLFAESGL